MKVLFLDLDGVICTSSCYGRGMDNKWGSYRFDPKCVSVLNFILLETGCEIILSSDWKLFYSLHEIREIFTHNGVIRVPIGFTSMSKEYADNKLEKGRSKEIKSWLDLHNKKDDIKWCAVDDLDLSEKFDINGEVVSGLKNFVYCKRANEGIKQCGIKEKIIKFLS